MLEGKRYPIHVYVLLVSLSPNFQSVLHQVLRSIFELTAILRQVHPKMTLNTMGSKVPHIPFTYTVINYFHYYDVKIKVAHICSTSTFQSQISIYLTLPPAIFQLQAILRHMRQMTPK